MKFSWKNIENWRNWKTQFFWVGHFEFFLSKKKIFFCLILIQISHNLLGTKDFSKFWWLPWFPENFWGAYTFATQCKLEIIHHVFCPCIQLPYYLPSSVIIILHKLFMKYNFLSKCDLQFAFGELNEHDTSRM